MKRWSIRALRFLFITVGAVVVTSLSIDATDTLTGSQSALSIFVREITEGDCPSGMVEVERSDRTRFCIDIYEASVGDGCLFQNPALSDETARNASLPDCGPRSVADKLPWTNVTQLQAGELCARAGKRLPGNDEWYAAVRGTPDNEEVCALDGDIKKGGQMNQCRSGAGAHDMIGNAWEWTLEVAVDGTVAGVSLPEAGFVAAVDQLTGVPIQSSSTPSETYNRDYVWTRAEGEYGVMRGGFHGGRDDSGLYSLHAAVDAQFAGPAIGFRCALSL